MYSVIYLVSWGILQWAKTLKFTGINKYTTLYNFHSCDKLRSYKTSQPSSIQNCNPSLHFQLSTSFTLYNFSSDKKKRKKEWYIDAGWMHKRMVWSFHLAWFLSCFSVHIITLELCWLQQPLSCFPESVIML